MEPPEPGLLAVVADLSGIATFHCNDMLVDAQGRAYVGNFGYDFEAGMPRRSAALALVPPDEPCTWQPARPAATGD